MAATGQWANTRPPPDNLLSGQRRSLCRHSLRERTFFRGSERRRSPSSPTKTRGLGRPAPGRNPCPALPRHIGLCELVHCDRVCTHTALQWARGGRPVAAVSEDFRGNFPPHGHGAGAIQSATFPVFPQSGASFALQSQGARECDPGPHVVTFPGRHLLWYRPPVEIIRG